MNPHEDQSKKDPQLVEDITLLDNLLGVEARKPGKAASLPAAIRIIETLEPAGGQHVPVFPASYAGATDQSPPVYDLSGIEYGEGEDTVRVKNGSTKIPRIIKAKLCALDSPQSQANRMEPAFLECEDLQELVPQSKAIIPRRPDTDGASSVLTLPHRVADFRVRLSDRNANVSAAITAFSKGDCLPLLKTFPTSLIFGFWNSRGDDEQGIKHARILLSRIDARDVIPCRRHSLYSGPYSKDEFGQAVLQRDISKEEGEKLSKEGFSSAPSDGLGGVIVNGPIERLSLLSLSDLSRLHCLAPQLTDSDSSSSSTPPPSAQELTNAARRYLFCIAALAEGHERSKGSHRLRSGCELVAKGEVQLDFRGSTPSEAASLKSLYFDRSRLIKVAKDSMSVLTINSEAVSYTVTAETLAGKIVAADQAEKEAKAAKDKAIKEATAARKKADIAMQKAEELNQSALASGKATDRSKADKKKAEALDLEQKALEAEAKVSAEATPATNKATNAAETPPSA
jgi:CRISPR-associated protein Csb1